MQNKQVKAVQGFIDTYNRQNYSQMKRTLSVMYWVLPLRKHFKRTFDARFNKFGMAKIDSIKFISKKHIAAYITYEKDNAERDLLNLNINSRNKIVGFNFRIPSFRYLKNEDKVDKITEDQKTVKLDSLLSRKSKQGLNGNVIAIDGNFLYKKCVGYSNFDTKELLNDSSVFELASCSKQFTGIAIMILVEHGKLNYNDSIQRFIPDFPYHNITIENLLTHTSGLPEYEPLFEKRWDKSKIATNYDILDLFKKYKPKAYHKPNVTFDYSNTGYAMLSLIIEKVSGTSYSDFLEKNIFKPIGMNNTRVYNTRRYKNEKVHNYAYGYMYSEKLKSYCLPDSLKKYDFVRYLDAITGDGTVNSTIIDLLKWDKALRENSLVKKHTLERAYTKYQVKSGKKNPYGADYGYGEWIVEDDKIEKVVYHAGGWPGYTTFILHFVERPMMVAILTNVYDESITKLTDQITKILLE